MIRAEYATPTRRAFPVKRISVKQSRRNTARRRRKVAARQARAGHWRAQSQPTLGSSRVHYEIGAQTEAMSYGGIAAVHRLVTQLGLPTTIDATLQLLRVFARHRWPDTVEEQEALWRPMIVSFQELSDYAAIRRYAFCVTSTGTTSAS